MTAINTAKPFAFTGKGKLARASALTQIAPLAFGEETSRGASLENMAKVLGTAPPEELVKAARIEYHIGRIAARLPVSECRKGKTSPADRLELARDIVLRMAAPPVEGKATRPLRKHQIARRTPVQQRVFRAAEEATNLFFADLGLSSKARAGQAAKNAKQAAAKRNPAPASGMGKAGNASPVAPSHSQLVKPAKPDSVDDILAFLGTQSRMLQDYVNKNAKLCPVDAATAVQAFRGDILKAANALQERKAIAKTAPAKPDSKAKLVAVK